MHDQNDHDREVDPNQVVDEGKNVEAAVAKGAERLGVTVDQVEYEVLEQGSQGVFGLIGAKPAKVVVRSKAAGGSDDVSAKVDEMVTRIMELMGIDAQVKTHLEDDIHRVEIETTGADGLLIGKKGESLEDLGHLLRRMVGKQLKKSVRMDVDVGGYKKRRGSALTSKALSLAARVKATARDMEMEPLAAAERRVVHLALAGDPQVKTHTVGDGDLRTVVISSATKRGPRGSGGGGRRGGYGRPRRGGEGRRRYSDGPRGERVEPAAEGEREVGREGERRGAEDVGRESDHRGDGGFEGAEEQV
ncbi:MAG: RNA-binding cell elongation regulator Jag/EloR [bacterium]